MFIEVGFGSKDNKKSFNCVDYNYDAQPLYRANGNVLSENTSGNLTALGMSRPSTRNDESLGDYANIPNALIAFEIPYTVISTNVLQDGVRTKKNKQIIDGLGFGNFDNAYDNIIPGKIDYTNHTATAPSTPIDWIQPWASDFSVPNIAYVPVNIGTGPDDIPDAPQNWDLQKYINYYHVVDENTKDMRMTNFTNTLSVLSTWESFCTYCQTNNIQPYYNDSRVSWIWFGDEDAKIMFACGRNGSGSQSASQISRAASFNIFNTGDPGTSNIGILRLGDTLEAPNLIQNQWGLSTLCDDDGICAGKKAMKEGRFSTDTQYTNPICDCSLMQFGTFTYKGKKYFGVWAVTYEQQYYWGYKRTGDTGSWNYDNLDTENPVDYTNPEIHAVLFRGVCLDDLGVIVEEHEGDPADKDDPVPTFNYPYTPIGFTVPHSLGTIADPDASGIHIYAMTKAVFSQFAEKLYNWGSFADQFLQDLEEKGLIKTTYDLWKNSDSEIGIDPSRCVLFARKMPKAVSFSFPDGLHEVRMCGWDQGMKARHADSETYSSAIYSITFGGPTKSFLDYAPYCSATLYLPFIGQVHIDPSTFMDGSIQIQYHFDIITGKCVAEVITTCANRSGNGRPREVRYGPYTGDCSIDLPLAIQDANAMGRQYGIATAAVSTIGSVLGGNAAGALAGASSLAQAQMIPKQTGMINSLGSMVPALIDTRILLQISFPSTVHFDETKLKIGMSAYKPGKVSDFTGYSKFSYIDTSGINATDGEKAAIEALMKGGVYL